MYQQFFVLFAIMFSGYLLRKFVIIDFNMNRGLNRFIVYFSFPCLMISNNHFEIPVVIQSYLQLIGDVATPMVMIFIGSSLYGCNLLDMIKDRVIAESVIMKLLVMPVITALLVMFLPLSVLAKTMCVFSCAFPTAAMVPILTEQEGKNVEFASMILLLSTVLSMVTIPVIVEFARIVFG